MMGLILLIFFSFWTPTQARAGVVQGALKKARNHISCRIAVRALEETLAEVQSDFLTPADRANIDAIFENATLTDKEKAKQEFEIVLEARLRLVPPEDARVIRQVNEDAFNNFWTSGNQINGHGMTSFDGEQFAHVILLRFPMRYEESLLEYFVRLHESEHIVQNLRMIRQLQEADRTGEEIAETMVKLDKSVLPSQMAENGGMSGEWKLINPVPKSARENLANELLHDAKLDPSHAKGFSKIFSLGGADRETYLRTVAPMRGYSKLKLLYKLRPKLSDLKFLIAPSALLINYRQKSGTTSQEMLIELQGPNGKMMPLLITSPSTIHALMPNRR